MADNAPDLSGFDIADPAQLQAQQDSDWDTLQARAPNGQAAARIALARPMAGTNPYINQQQQLQQRLQSILSDSNAGAPEDEDPLDKQLRIAQAVSTGMVGTDPNVAMRATAMAAKLQQAKTQQAQLSANTDYLKSEAAAKNQQTALQSKLGTIVFARQGKPDSNGLPTGLEAVDSVDPNDPDYATKALKIVSDAKANGDTVVPMTGDQFMNGKAQVAQMRAAASVQAAQIRANSMWQTAMLKAQQQGQGLTGNSAVQANRMLGAANGASAALRNIAEMPVGASSGFFGVGAAPGESLTRTGIDQLRNQVSSQDVQSYTVATAGLARSLAILDGQGGIQGIQQFSEALNKQIEIRSSDTKLTMLQKMAEARQIVDKNIAIYMANPRVPDSVKEQVQGTLDEMHDAIPFTVHDITAFRQGKDPKMTFEQFAAKQGIGRTGPAATPATPAAKMLPTGGRLSAYAAKNFGGDTAKATNFLKSQGYK